MVMVIVVNRMVIVVNRIILCAVKSLFYSGAKLPSSISLSLSVILSFVSCCSLPRQVDGKIVAQIMNELIF